MDPKHSLPAISELVIGGSRLQPGHPSIETTKYKYNCKALHAIYIPYPSLIGTTPRRGPYPCTRRMHFTAHGTRSTTRIIPSHDMVCERLQGMVPAMSLEFELGQRISQLELRFVERNATCVVGSESHSEIRGTGSDPASA